MFIVIMNNIIRAKLDRGIYRAIPLFLDALNFFLDSVGSSLWFNLKLSKLYQVARGAAHKVFNCPGRNKIEHDPDKSICALYVQLLIKEI